MKKFFMLFIIGNLLFLSVTCQENWKIYNTVNTGDNGILGGYVYDFHTGENNAMWIGTSSGISLWDGLQWSSITNVDGMAVDEVRVIACDLDDNIWISHGSSQSGVTMYDGENFTRFTVTEGLIHNKVDDIMVDNNGNVWCATWGGISMFNGSEWTSYSTGDGLPDVPVTCLAQYGDATILFGTLGAGTYMLQSGIAYPFCWEPDSDDYISDVFVDGVGNIWVSGSQTYKYDNGWEIIDPFPPGSFGSVYNFKDDTAGRMYFSTSAGFTIWDGYSYSYYTTEDNLPHNIVFSSHLLNDSIWIGTADGAAILYNDEWSVVNTDDNGLLSERVKAVFKEGSNVWCCTDKGISKYDGSTWQNFKHTDAGKEIRMVFKGLHDSNGNLWFASGSGIFKYGNNQWEVFDDEVDEMFSAVVDLVEDAAGNLWFANANYLLKYDGIQWIQYNDTAGFGSSNILGLFEDSSGRIWISSYQGISVYDNHQFQHFIEGTDYESTYPLTGFTEDMDGKLYAYGYNDILLYTEGEWETFYLGHWFSSAICDTANQLWFSTIHDGLLRYDGETWHVYTTADGLSANDVNSVYRAQDGTFYASTNHGITEFSAGTNTGLSEGKNHGFQAASIYPNPTTGKFAISLAEAHKFISIQVYNQMGQKLSEKLINNSRKTEMALPGPKGVYFIRYNTSDGKVGTCKVIKE